MSKWLDTMILKHGSEEAVREHMRKSGQKGGQVYTVKGFAVTKTAKEAANKR